MQARKGLTMKYIELVADKGSADTVAAIAEKIEAYDFRLGEAGKDGMRPMRLLVADDKLQSVLDSLQKMLGSRPSARVMVLPVEIVLPTPSEQERKEEDAAVEAREALYEEVEKNVRLDLNLAVLVALSTIVAAIGLIESNVTVVIGAMVIAPLLGPNLAFGLGTALGDISLMRKSALTTSAGVAIRCGKPGAFGAYQRRAGFRCTCTCIRCGGGPLSDDRFVERTGGCNGGGGVAAACRNAWSYAGFRGYQPRIWRRIAVGDQRRVCQSGHQRGVLPERHPPAHLVGKKEGKT